MKRTLQVLHPLLVAAVITASLLPPATPIIRSINAIPYGDKMAHFSAYALLTIIPIATVHRWKIAALIAAIMAVLGVALEAVQTVMPGRVSDIADIAANNLGVLAGILIGKPLRNG